MTIIQNIFQEILKEITPTTQEVELIEKITKKLKKLLDNKAQELNIKYTKIEPQGSTGIKKTQLRDDYDIDLFIGLDCNLYKNKYARLSKSKLKKESKQDFLELCNKWIIQGLKSTKFYNPRLLYAEHPYVTVDYIINDIKIEIDIVLYFDLDLDYIKKYGPITAVDRSPWHGRFVKENLSIGQKNDVRLLKQFFKANHCYGDKSAVGKVGFIGYSAELLIFYYDNILNLFKNFNIIDKKPLDYYNRTEKELQKITHFQNDYLIIIDPIDKNRNVASAISQKSYKYCNQQIKDFLKHPSQEFFKLKQIKEANLSNLTDPLLSKIFIIELKNNDKNIHYTLNRDKLYSLAEKIKRNAEKEYSHAEKFGKVVYEVYFEEEISEYNIAFYCEKPQISQFYTRRGPPIDEIYHVDNFKLKNPDFFEKDGFLWVKNSRENYDFLEFLKSFIKGKIPTNFAIINISDSFHVESLSGKRCITILTEMVLPFCI